MEKTTWATNLSPIRRKTKNFSQWMGYINSELERLRGLDPHERPRR